MGIGSRIGSRIAQNIRDSFAHYPKGQFQSVKDPWTLGSYIGVPLARNAPMMGGVGYLAGGLAGGAGQIGADDEAVNNSALTGAGIGAALGVGVPYAVMGKRLIVAVARALKNKVPQIADEQAISLAHAAQTNKDARAQIERILGPIDWDRMR